MRVRGPGRSTGAGWRRFAIAGAIWTLATAAVAGPDAPTAGSLPPVRLGVAHPDGVASRPSAPTATFRTSLDGARFEAARGSFRHVGEFYVDHLLPRLESRLRDVALTSPVGVLGLHDREGGAYEALQDLAERRATSAARRALKEFALEETGLERRASQWLAGRKEAIVGPEASAPKPARDAEGWRFHLGTSGGLPRCDWSRQVGKESSLRFRLHADGRVGLDLVNPGARRAKLTLDADVFDQAYSMGWRAAF